METSMIITIGIAITGGFGTLIGVVWNQHCRRMDIIDKRVDDLAKSTESKFDAIYCELKDFRRDFNDWLLKITSDTVTKNECNRRREDCNK